MRPNSCLKQSTPADCKMSCLMNCTFYHNSHACRRSCPDIAWDLTGVSHRCHMVQNGVSVVNFSISSLTVMKSNAMQPNSRQALKSCYGNYWVNLMTSIYTCDGRSSIVNFVANALMTIGGQAESSWTLAMGSTSAVMTPMSLSLNESVDTLHSVWNHFAGPLIYSLFVRNSCYLLHCKATTNNNL